MCACICVCVCVLYVQSSRAYTYIHINMPFAACHLPHSRTDSSLFGAVGEYRKVLNEQETRAWTPPDPYQVSLAHHIPTQGQGVYTLP